MFIVELDGAGTETGRFFYHTDHLGSVRALTDSPGGAVVRSYDYSAYGRILADTGSGAALNPFTYTAREYHATSSLYFYRARFYDPAVGGFLSVDPIGLEGGIHPYAYVSANPVLSIDPHGEASLTTDNNAGTTTFDPRPEDPQGKPLSIPSRTDVVSSAEPGAGGPFKTPDVKVLDIPPSRPYGPTGAYIDTGDARGRDIHGGGSRLVDPFAPRQGFVPTRGCTRAQNEDLIRLGKAIRDFQTRHPRVKIPFERK